MQIKCHSICGVSDLPDQRQHLTEEIQNVQSIPLRVKETLLQTLAGMPRGDRLCHGDLNPGNILMAKSGPVIIDWVDASVGDPIADVARTWVLLSQDMAPCSSYPRFVKTLLRLFRQTYLAQYLELGHYDKKQLIDWIRIVAAARMSYSSSAVQSWLFTLVETSNSFGH